MLARAGSSQPAARVCGVCDGGCDGISIYYLLLRGVPYSSYIRPYNMSLPQQKSRLRILYVKNELL